MNEITFPLRSKYFLHALLILSLTFVLTACGGMVVIGLETWRTMTNGPPPPQSPQLYDAAFEGNISDLEDALSGNYYAVPDINARCQVRNAFCWQQTALELAVKGRKNRGKRLAIVSTLVKHGARADSIDDSGRSALHYAISNYASNSEIINVLVQAGADVNARPRNGPSPLTQVYHRTELDLTKTIKVLVDAGARE